MDSPGPHPSPTPGLPDAAAMRVTPGFSDAPTAVTAAAVTEGTGWRFEAGPGRRNHELRASQLRALAHEPDRRLGSYRLGRLLMKLGELDDARPLLEEAAGLGHPSAAYWAHVLAGLEPDTLSQQKSLRFLNQAARLGHALARRELARQRVQVARTRARWLRSLLHYAVASATVATIAIVDSDDPRVS